MDLEELLIKKEPEDKVMEIKCEELRDGVWRVYVKRGKSRMMLTALVGKQVNHVTCYESNLETVKRMLTNAISKGSLDSAAALQDMTEELAVLVKTSRGLLMSEYLKSRIKQKAKYLIIYKQWWEVVHANVMR